MFKEKIKQLSESDIKYIEQQIDKLENEYKNNALATKNGMWRIASNAELFPTNELNSEGILTPEQRRTTWAYVISFLERYSEFLEFSDGAKISEYETLMINWRQ